jgi:2-iminoacetate synthase ThiH
MAIALGDKTRSLTETYTTQGLKLLQHTQVLCEIQQRGRFRPIQIQLAPTEACESDCPFCSVGNRPVRASIPVETIRVCLRDFADLGARALQITGGGNPLIGIQPLVQTSTRSSNTRLISGWR